MTIQTDNWEMYANNNRTLQVTVKDPSDVVVNLTSFTLRLEIKLDSKIATATYITKSTTTGAQAAITNAAGGIVEFYITPTDFATAPRYHFPYTYAVKAKTGANKEYTVLRGYVKFLEPVFTSVT